MTRLASARATRPRPTDAHRPLALTLKRRARQLLRGLLPAERDAFRFAPAWLVCRFDAPGLKTEAPGVDGVRLSPRFGRLAARLKLPLPLGQQQGRQLVGALFVLRDENTARVLVQPSPAISTSMVARVAERCAAASDLLASAKIPLVLEVLSPQHLDPATLARLATLGGLLCGRPAPWLSEALARAAATVTPDLLFDWVPHGPTAQARVQLLLGEKHPLDVPLPASLCSPLALHRVLLLALRRTPLAQRARFRAHLSRELLPGGIPLCLVPRLTARLGALKHPLQLTAVHSREGVELRLPDGALFGRARTLLQARVRAMLLARAVWGRVPESWLTAPQWQKLAERLSSERSRTTWLFAMGPEGSALASRFVPGREPRMRELDAEGTLRRIVAAAREGHAVEVIPCTPAQQLVALRLSQLAWRAAAASATEPLALKDGERMLLYDRGRFKSFTLGAFFRRPRRAVMLEDAPGPRKADALGATVECAVNTDGRDGAVLTYRAKGCTFRERVPLDAVGAHLKATAALCHGYSERTVLIVQTDAAVQRYVSSGRAQVLPSCTLEVRGDLARGLRVLIGEQTFKNFTAAAETILSAWQVGVRGHLDISRAYVGVSGVHGEALHCLYARAVVIRRLNAHIDRLVGLKARRHRADF